MVQQVAVLEEWAPERMEPGTLFVLENAGEVGQGEDPYWAVLACPNCGTVGLITRTQLSGLTSIICGAGTCSAEFFLEDEGAIRRRSPM